MKESERREKEIKYAVDEYGALTVKGTLAHETQNEQNLTLLCSKCHGIKSMYFS